MMRLIKTKLGAVMAAARRSDNVNTNKVCLTLMVALLCVPASLPVFAASAGEVTHLSGTLSVQRPDGAILALSQKSEIKPGDVLSTQRDSYAQINFSDGSSMTMRPQTQMKIESYQYSQDAPASDNAFFRLVKGGMRTVTGLVGKRGNQGAYQIGTATATIGIRGSVADVIACTPDCAGVTNTSQDHPPGSVSVTTYNGVFVMTNAAGEHVVEAGQFGISRGANVPITVAAGVADQGLAKPLPIDFKPQVRDGCK